MERHEPAGIVKLDLPEHGELSLPVAGIGRRAAAAVIDMSLMLLFGLMLLVIASVGSAMTLAEELIAPAAIAIGALLPIVAPLGFELVQRGQSPGKRLLDLRVISADGTPAAAGQLFLRNVLRLVDFLPFGYFAGLCAVFASKRGQRLGDLVANTLVIREDEHALLELGLTTQAETPKELHGVPEPVLRAAKLLLDPTRDVDAGSRQSREAEIAALVRQYRPDLSGEPDGVIWTRLRRGLGA